VKDFAYCTGELVKRKVEGGSGRHTQGRYPPLEKVRYLPVCELRSTRKIQDTSKISHPGPDHFQCLTSDGRGPRETTTEPKK
jgi:hypothetical protein